MRNPAFPLENSEKRGRFTLKGDEVAGDKVSDNEIDVGPSPERSRNDREETISSSERVCQRGVFLLPDHGQTIALTRKTSLNFVHPANRPRNGPTMPRDKSRKAVYVYAAANAGMSLTTSINLPELIS